MTAPEIQALTALVVAAGGTITAITALIHSINTRKKLPK